MYIKQHIALQEYTKVKEYTGNRAWWPAGWRDGNKQDWQPGKHLTSSSDNQMCQY